MSWLRVVLYSARLRNTAYYEGDALELVGLKKPRQLCYIDDVRKALMFWLSSRRDRHPLYFYAAIRFSNRKEARSDDSEREEGTLTMTDAYRLFEVRSFASNHVLFKSQLKPPSSRNGASRTLLTYLTSVPRRLPKSRGAKNVPGMLAEVAFNSWSDISFFDVSQIVNQTDFNGIKQMWPAGDRAPVSGCVEYLGVVCDNVYLQPDDVQTKATTETALICTLGTATNDTAIKPRDVPADDSPVFTRDFVLGKWSSKRH
ncbi:hypothetical protein P8C59_001273 [Phyllachora maydis]|uniref:Uncharacterized protein n=1 Tax=Phyllachora maydis TaxID=1825666 RepID=A0AAD9HXW4_9PEZI|nr:hypothetical protein P8C59_001273 [Phyllachora maydis]